MFGRRISFCVLACTSLAVGSAPGAEATEPSPLTPLVDAAAARLQTAEPVAAFKWLTKGSIEDPARADQVLAAVTADAATAGIDPDYVGQVFSDQISATEAVEYGRFSEWKLDPAAAPTTAPDLSASRSAIDALNHTMVAEIATHWELLQSPQCVDDRSGAVAVVADAHQLDALYREALDFATHSYCQPAS